MLLKNNLSILQTHSLYGIPISELYTVEKDDFKLELKVVNFNQPQPDVMYYDANEHYYPTLINYFYKSGQLLESSVMTYLMRSSTEFEKCLNILFETLKFKYTK